MDCVFTWRGGIITASRIFRPIPAACSDSSATSSAKNPPRQSRCRYRVRLLQCPCEQWPRVLTPVRRKAQPAFSGSKPLNSNSRRLWQSSRTNCESSSRGCRRRMRWSSCRFRQFSAFFPPALSRCRSPASCGKRLPERFPRSTRKISGSSKCHSRKSSSE